MTWPGFRHIVTQIKTAITVHITPTSVMLNRPAQAVSQGSVFDVKLIEAYIRLEEATCPYCGQPRWVCDAREDANWFGFTVEIGFCKGKEVKDHFDEEESRLREKKKDSQLKPGEFMYLKTKADGGFLYPDVKPTDRPRRAAWIQQLQEDQLVD